jgi:hypothetical protein
MAKATETTHTVSLHMTHDETSALLIALSRIGVYPDSIGVETFKIFCTLTDLPTHENYLYQTKPAAEWREDAELLHIAKR